MLHPNLGRALLPPEALAPGGAALAQAFRRLPVPVVGRLHDGRLLPDLRCLEDEAAFLTQLPDLAVPPVP